MKKNLKKMTRIMKDCLFICTVFMMFGYFQENDVYKNEAVSEESEVSDPLIDEPSAPPKINDKERSKNSEPYIFKEGFIEGFDQRYFIPGLHM